MRSPRRRSPPRRSPPRSPSFLPPELKGACYRCLRFGHVRARCFYPTRCYRCWAEGHHAAECPDRRRDFRKRGRSPLSEGERRAAARQLFRSRHSPRRLVRAGSAETVSGRDASTGNSSVHVPHHYRRSPTPEFPLPGRGRPRRDAAVEPVPAPLLSRSPVVHDASWVERSSGRSPRVAADAAPRARRSEMEAGPSNPPPREASRRAPSQVERSYANGVLPGAAGQDAASLVVVPRTAAIQAAEDALELALVAMVVGARPLIRAAAIYEALRNRFNILRDNVDIRGHELDDFIVRFRRREDRDRVLASTGWGPLIPLRWRLWSRQACGVLAEFSLRVVVALRGLPAHARKVAVAQLRLGTCCCEVQVSNVRDRSIDDDREFFVQAWCKDPSLILPVDSIFIPEPLLPGVPDPGVRRGLRYQVFARVVELQGLRPPPRPPDNDDDDDADEGDGFGGDAGHGFDYDYDPSPRRDSDDDSVDSDPRHRNSHPTCAFRQEVSSPKQRAVLVGGLLCPVRERAFSLSGSPRMRLAPSSPPATPSRSISLKTPFSSRPTATAPASSLSCRRALLFDITPTQVLLRESSTIAPGLVGRFINISPRLLQDGRSAGIPPAPFVDWWPSICVQAEQASRVLEAQPLAPPQSCSDWWSKLVGAELLQSGASDVSTGEHASKPSAPPCSDLPAPGPQEYVNAAPPCSDLPVPGPEALPAKGGPTAESVADFIGNMLLPLEEAVLQERPRLRRS
ncbi:hypothetical protein SORBI_3010G159300 [Sorghum bicolor]|uniref:CCHC-type domain-containing protein n=1 Tax=Sorghum bicolor TaxID=4558 RepID=C5Z432_SORBI|nr:hypothetical protein SORBI_3010G159300 [Sorghum bicolor]